MAYNFTVKIINYLPRSLAHSLALLSSRPSNGDWSEKEDWCGRSGAAAECSARTVLEGSL